MSINAGTLRHRVLLETPNLVPNDFGEFEIDGFSRIDEFWARITPLTGRELLEARQIKAEISHRVVIRFVKNISTEMRLVFGNNILEISSIANLRHLSELLELLCIERLRNES